MSENPKGYNVIVASYQDETDRDLFKGCIYWYKATEPLYEAFQFHPSVQLKRQTTNINNKRRYHHAVFIFNVRKFLFQVP